MTIEVTIKAGLSNSITRTVEAPISVGSILTPSVKSALGVGDNVQAIKDGVVLTSGTMITASCTIRLETVAASKAA